MKKFLKVLGAAALIAGLTPYQISGDEKTGDVKVKALLWQLTATSGKGEDRRNVDINFGFPSKREAVEEADLFSDELTVNYGGAPEEAAEAVAEEVEKDAEAVAEEVEKDVEAAAEEVEKAAEEAEEAAEPEEP